MNIVDEASATPTELGLIVQESLTVGEGFPEVAANLEKRLQIPGMVLGRKGDWNLFGDISNHFAEFLEVPRKMLNVGTKVGVLLL